MTQNSTDVYDADELKRRTGRSDKKQSTKTTTPFPRECSSRGDGQDNSKKAQQLVCLCEHHDIAAVKGIALPTDIKGCPVEKFVHVIRRCSDGRPTRAPFSRSKIKTTFYKLHNRKNMFNDLQHRKMKHSNWLFENCQRLQN